MINERSVTVDQIMKWRPCGCDELHNGVNYTRQRVVELFDGRDTLIADALVALEIPAEDRIWVLIRMLNGAEQRDFARWNARQVLHLWDAPGVVREYLQTGDETLQDAAWAAARAAVRAAARAAVRTAAGDAAWAAARAAAWDAARAAARDTAWAAAWAAAWDAARAAARDTAWDAQSAKTKSGEVADDGK